MTRVKLFRYGAAQICVSLMLMRGVPAYAVQQFAMEMWVGQCEIKTLDLYIPHAADVNGGVTVQKHGRWGWSPRVGSAKGVLVVHPVARDEPAEIEFTPKGGIGSYRVLRIVARGADDSNGPGVKMAIIAKKQPIKEVDVGPEWTTVEIPVSDLPAGTRSVTLRISPIGWLFEYCYVDKIEVSK